MPLWTLFNKTLGPVNGIIKQHQPNPGTADGSLPIGLDESLAWLVETHEPQPTEWNPATHKLQRSNGVIAIDPVDTRTGTRTWSWTVVELSAAELADAARIEKLQTEQSAVGAIAERWLDDQEPVESTDVARVARFLAIRDGLDSQAP